MTSSFWFEYFRITEPFEPQQEAVGSQHPPGVFEGFVVTGEPLLGSGHAAVDVVSHEVFGMFGTLPLNKHGRLGVSGGNNLTGSRWDACSRKNKSLLNSSNYIISGLSFWLLNLKIWFPLFPFPRHWDRSCCFELRSSLVFCRPSDFKLLNFMCHLSRNMLFKLCSIFCVRILHLPRFHLSFFFVIWAYLQICLWCWRVNWTFHPTVKQYTSTFNIPERRARFTTSGWFRQRHISCQSHLICTWFNPSILLSSHSRVLLTEQKY